MHFGAGGAVKLLLFFGFGQVAKCRWRLGSRDKVNARRVWAGQVPDAMTGRGWRHQGVPCEAHKLYPDPGVKQPEMHKALHTAIARDLI